MENRHIALAGAGLFGFLLLGLLIWYMSVTPAPGAQNTAIPTEFVEPTPQTITESTQYYDIHASYPAKTPLETTASAQADTAAIAAMKAFEEDSIASFKRDGGFASLTPEDLEMQGYAQGRKQELGIDYTRFDSPTTVSYSFTIYMDTMGAHPNSYFRTFTFDLETGKLLRLGDFFVPGANYLSILSEISRRELPKQIGEYADTEYIADGTMPQEESFQSFVIDGDKLTIVFPPYQVGPYAIGVQTVGIPFSELEEILKEGYK